MKKKREGRFTLQGSMWIHYINRMLISLRYFAKKNIVFCTVYRNVDVGKYINDGLKLQGSPDTGQSHFKRTRELAVENPCLMLFKERGTNDGWNGRAFWWPVLVAPKMY